MERLLSPRELREQQEQLEQSIEALVSEFVRIDETNVETITDLPREGDGIENNLATHFDVAINSIWNGVNKLREEGKISCGSYKGGPANDQRTVLAYVALPAEQR